MLARRFVLVAVLTGTLAFAACGGDSQTKGADRTTVPSVATTAAGGTQMTEAPANLQTTVTITAKNVAFTPTKIEVPANQQLSVTFDNEDAGVAHNLHIKVPDEQKTDVKQGVDKETLTFTVTKAGKYEFMCDVHPTMKGDFIVH